MSDGLARHPDNGAAVTVVKGGLQHTDTNKTMLAGCLSDLSPGMGAVIAQDTLL